MIIANFEEEQDDDAAEAMRIPKATETLMEDKWEKMVLESMKQKVDEGIAVLRQNYQEGEMDRKLLRVHDDAENKPAGKVEEAAGDGTQMLSFINCIEIKISLADVHGLSTAKDSSGQEEMIVQKFRINK